MRSLRYHRSTRAVVTALAITVVVGLFYVVRSADAHHKPWHDKGGHNPQPTLTLNAPASMTYGQPAETLTTTGGSGGGAVSYSIGTSNGCSVSGDKLTVTNASGTCTVTATKAADNNYESATSVPQTVNLHKADQATLNYTGATSGTFGDKLTLSSTGGSGTGALTYEATGTACRIDPNDSTKLEITSGTGTCSVEVKKAADNNYESASSGPQTITVSKAQQDTLTCNKGEFLAQYRNELMTFGTQPVLTRCEPDINNDWVSGSPGSGVNADSFTARWIGTFDFGASDYEFTATSDDGIRLWVDGQLLIDQWKDQAATSDKATKTMTAGAHEIKVEYYENTGSAVAKVSWAALPPPPPPPPPGEGVAMGAYIANAPWNASNIDTFNEMVGTNAKIVHWYQDWAHNGAFQSYLFDAVYQRGAMPMLTMEPWDYSAGTNQANYQLQDIIDGQHDALIRNFAQASAAYGRPYYLRFAHEMNGNWYSWSPGVNGNNGGPAEYARAFRHVHDIFEQEGATNVRWVWCPNVNWRLSELDQYYPGDAYVDWTCMDGYNWGTTNSEGWKPMGQVFGTTYDRVVQVAPTKPMMIGETASTELGGDKAAWIRQGYYNDLPYSLPRVRAVVWFNENRETDWRVNSSQASLDAYKEVAASSGYQGTLP